MSGNVQCGLGADSQLRWLQIPALFCEKQIEFAVDCFCTDVGELQDRGRRAVTLRYGERRSRSQMAELLGMTSDGVKSLLRRLRDTLRACVERKLET